MSYPSKITYQLKVLCGLLIKIVSKILIKTGQMFHLHLNPVLSEVIVPLEFISEKNHLLSKKSPKANKIQYSS